jgi:polysaccharide biosynthesis transport protein
MPNSLTPQVPVSRREAPARKSAADELSFDFIDYLRIFYRRRWPALIAFLVLSVPPLLLTLSADSVYEGTARVRVGLPLPTVGDRPTQEAAKSTINDYVEVFRSRRVARSALEELRLWNPPFERTPNVVLRLKEAIGKFVPTEATASAATARDAAEPENLRGPVDALLANLDITPVAESRLIDVTVSATDPTVAANLTNAIVRHAINQQLGLRVETTQQTSQWLSQQLTEAREKLEKSEAALQGFKEQRKTVAVDDRQNIVVQKLSDLNGAVTRAKMERIAKEQLYKRATELRSNPSSLDTLPGVAGASYVRQLREELAGLQRRRAELSEQYGELHPDMVTVNGSIKDTQARLDAELAKIADSVHNEYLSAAAQERSLTAALEAQKSEALNLNRQGLEYGALEREALADRELYNRLLQQAQQTGVSSELKAVDMAIVDAAEPAPTPARPARTRNAIASLSGGLFGALGFALVLEFLDKRVKSPDQIKRDLGLAFLGYIPLIRSENSEEPLIHKDGVAASFHEAVRRVRANLILSTAADGCRTVIVTSSVPREGKTTVSTNLALGLSQGGLRVLLMDADLRRSRVHRQLELEGDAGLSQVLAGIIPLDKALRTLPGTTLMVLPAGPCPPNPPELLSSAKFAELLKTLEARFDWIIIDSPPIMAVADAALLANQATGVVFVLGSEMVPLESARVGIDQLTNVGVPLLGGVLNRVDVERQGFYYSKYYNPDYEHYYTS